MAITNCSLKCDKTVGIVCEPINVCEQSLTLKASNLSDTDATVIIKSRGGNSISIPVTIGSDGMFDVPIGDTNFLFYGSKKNNTYTIELRGGQLQYQEQCFDMLEFITEPCNSIVNTIDPEEIAENETV